MSKLERVSLRSEHELSVGLKARSCFWLGEDVGLQSCSLDVFQFDNVSGYLFDHVVNACEKVFTPFVIARELLSEGDERLVINVERCGCGLSKSEFVE